MSLLFRVIYATHANGTHHKLALDGLRHLATPDADRRQRLFLKHAELMMQGSKAPDDEFKDFKNHVLHVRDGYWGGAIQKTEAWYGHLINALKEQNWSEAAWAAGILSHYLTDPIQPFHTAQSEAENSIHRAAEWSINRSYNELRTLGEADYANLKIEVPGTDTWLRDLVCRGAEKANLSYEKLIAHYDINKGVVDPPAGLDGVSRRLISELLVYAAKTFAAVLDRAFAEAAVTPPDVDLTLDTVIAALKIPVKMVAKRLSDAEDRRIVEAMYDELKQTGRVEKTLPEDDRVVRDLHAKEVLPEIHARIAERRRSVMADKAAQAAKPAPRATPKPATVAVLTPARSGSDAHEARNAKTYLALQDDVEQAPSIGPKLAERLAGVGIKTVGDLLGASASTIATSLGQRLITETTIRDWQDQARLVVEVPGLRGTHAQLLTGSGIRSRDDLAEADPADLSVKLLGFATTVAGQSILRQGNPPDIEKIKSWVDNARAARAA